MTNIHILSIKLKENYRVLNSGLEIDFLPVTILVGDQGCGKSSLLELLRDNSSKLIAKLSDSVIKDGVKTYYFDTETMNPRIADMDNYTTLGGESRGIGVGAALISRFQSHGETLREFTVNRILEAKDCVLFLDEPEAALSLKNQYILARNIQKAQENNVQIILATHCLSIIESVEKVYSLEHLKWMESKEFINQSKTEKYE